MAALSDADVDALIARAHANDPTLTTKNVNALLRACLVARPGHRLIVADFNAIEPRTLFWSCDDTAGLEAFKHGDPYIDQAAAIWNVPREKVDRGNMRQLGKAAVIGCGYQLGRPDKFRDLAAKHPYNVDWSKVPSTPEDVISKYRETHPAVKAFWTEMQTAACAAADGYTTDVGPYTWGPSPLAPGRDVWLMLPSGRPIVYYKFKYNRSGWRTEATYLGQKNGKVVEVNFYGGLATENGTQGTDGDVLALSGVRCEAEGMPVVMHTHDELVLEVPENTVDAAVRTLDDIMCEAPPWAPGLPLKAEIFTCARYRK